MSHMPGDSLLTKQNKTLLNKYNSNNTQNKALQREKTTTIGSAMHDGKQTFALRPDKKKISI